MKIARRVLLFLFVNTLVVLTMSVILSLLGVQPYLTRYGLNIKELGVFSLVWGMGGAFISLALSRQMAKWMLGVKLVRAEADDPTQRWLHGEVATLARQAGLTSCPEVGIFHSPEPNAFATGPSTRRSLVAVSSGLLERMPREEVAAVLGHEITHIANGDMVTMTLLQGIINAFVLFLSRLLAYLISMGGKGRDSGQRPSYMAYYLWTMMFEIGFMLLGSLVIAYFSRRREFAADRGGASLAGKEKMIAALQSLQGASRLYDPSADKPSLEAFKIHTARKKGGLRYLLASHPPLEERIARLQANY